MDTSLALVPVHACPPLFSRADGFLLNYNHNAGRFAREDAPIIYECDGLHRSYGSNGLEVVRSVAGTLINTYV